MKEEQGRNVKKLDVDSEKVQGIKKKNQMTKKSENNEKMFAGGGTD